LEILKAREAARGDRRIGLAEIQFPMVHQNREYDIEVDTSIKTAEACAAEILTAFQKKADQAAGSQPSAFGYKKET